jgi:SAM-dependent methyltransferase
MREKKKRITCGAFEGEIEETDCPICRPVPPAPRLIHRLATGVGIWHCPACGLQYASPRFTEEALLATHENEAFTDLSFFDPPWSYEHWRESGDRTYVVSRLKADLLERFLPARGRVLDVGCGGGLLCLEASRRGFCVEGVEPSRRIAETARRVTGVPIHAGGIESFRPTAPFDGVVLWDVLEHVPDPMAMTRAAAAHLAPGGRLFLQVPNSSGISNRWKSLLCRLRLKRSDYAHFGFPWHVYSFNRRSLAALLEKSGLQSILMESWSHRMKRRAGDLPTRLFKRALLTDYLTAVAERRR